MRYAELNQHKPEAEESMNDDKWNDLTKIGFVFPGQCFRIVLGRGQGGWIAFLLFTTVFQNSSIGRGQDGWIAFLLFTTGYPN